MIDTRTKVFDKTLAAAQLAPRYLSSCGGTRSGKTFSNIQLVVLLHKLEDDRGIARITSVVSETMPHLKKGAIRDFKEIMGDEWDDSRWSQTEKTYHFPHGGIIEFFSADNAGKVHGPARDRLFVNEAQNISYETFRQLEVRTRGLIIIDYNPVESFWVNEKIEVKANCIRIHSTYKDNTFLTKEQIASIEDNKDDANWWRVYGEGLVGLLEGVIYDFTQVDEMPATGSLVEFYGMDFGFTHDPTAIVWMKADTGRKELYCQEVCFRTRMLNADIAEALKAEGVPQHSIPVYADCAEPKSIAEISQASGINVQPCVKGAPTRSEKLRFQIQWLQGWKLFITKGSTNMIKEARNYTWAKDKDGNQLNYPIDTWNHCMDAMRYGAYTHLAQQAGYGQYNVSYND